MTQVQMTASEAPDTRLKRLGMRSWRRGMKEMDLILGPFADARLGALDEETLARYDRLLDENDQDLFAVILGNASPPPEFADLLEAIADFSRARLRQA